MKQPFLTKLGRATKTGFIAGAMISFIVYAFVRILFYEFSFTAREETVNFLTIITAGGLLVSLALVIFLLLEMVVLYVKSFSIVISLPGFVDTNKEAAAFITAD